MSNTHEDYDIEAVAEEIRLTASRIDRSLVRGEVDVMLALDSSNSLFTLYKSGHMSKWAQLIQSMRIGFGHDDSLPWATFDTKVRQFEPLMQSDTVTDDLCRGNGTLFVPMLEWIVDQAGYTTSESGAFVRKDGDFGLSTDQPTLVFVVTDGLPADQKATAKLLRRMSRLPIFVQFVKVGGQADGLRWLRSLQGKGHAIDNVGLCIDYGDIDTIPMNVAWSLLGSFAAYHKRARRIGLVVK